MQLAQVGSMNVELGREPGAQKVAFGTKKGHRTGPYYFDRLCP